MEINPHAGKITVCKYNQQGFCKYRQQCSKLHVNKICPSHQSCLTDGCEIRHPRNCKTFLQLAKCKFTQCAYFHSPDESIIKVEKLEREVDELKEVVGQLSKSFKELHEELENMNIAKRKLNNYDKAKSTKDDVSQPKESNKIKNTYTNTTELKTRKNKVTKNTKTKGTRKGMIYKCEKCDHSCAKGITLKKHTNAKHQQEELKC